jgi:hypothetical protein
MDRIFRVLHVTGWQHITGHLSSKVMRLRVSFS